MRLLLLLALASCAHAAAPPPPPPPDNTAEDPPPAPPEPEVTTARVFISGPLEPATVMHIIDQVSAKTRACYDQQLAANPDLQGTLHVRLVIDGDGSVMGAFGKGFDKAVASCVEDEIKQLVFPAADGLTKADVPFVFAP